MTVTVIVPGTRLALTTTPSIGPSASDVTTPVKPALSSARNGRFPATRIETNNANHTDKRSFMSLVSLTFRFRINLLSQFAVSMGRARSELDMGNFPGLIVRQPDLRHFWTVVHIDVPAADSSSGHRIKSELLSGGIEFAERVLVGQAEPDHVILVDDRLVRIRVAVIPRQFIFGDFLGVNIDFRQAAAEKF